MIAKPILELLHSTMAARPWRGAGIGAPCTLEAKAQAIGVIARIIGKSYGPAGGGCLFAPVRQGRGKHAAAADSSNGSAGPPVIASHSATLLQQLHAGPVDNPIVKVLLGAALQHHSQWGDGAGGLVLVVAAALREISRAGAEQVQGDEHTLAVEMARELHVIATTVLPAQLLPRLMAMRWREDGQGEARHGEGDLAFEDSIEGIIHTTLSGRFPLAAQDFLEALVLEACTAGVSSAADVTERIHHLARHSEQLVVVDVGRSGVTDSRCIPGVLVPRGTSIAPSTPPAGVLAAGVSVVLKGLRASALNGRLGVVTGPQRADGRWPVQLVPAEKPPIAVKTASLAVTANVLFVGGDLCSLFTDKGAPVTMDNASFERLHAWRTAQLVGIAAALQQKHVSLLMCTEVADETTLDFFRRSSISVCHAIPKPEFDLALQALGAAALTCVPGAAGFERECAAAIAAPVRDVRRLRIANSAFTWIRPLPAVGLSTGEGAATAATAAGPPRPAPTTGGVYLTIAAPHEDLAQHYAKSARDTFKRLSGWLRWAGRHGHTPHAPQASHTPHTPHATRTPAAACGASVVPGGGAFELAVSALLDELCLTSRQTRPALARAARVLSRSVLSIPEHLYCNSGGSASRAWHTRILPHLVAKHRAGCHSYGVGAGGTGHGARTADDAVVIEPMDPLVVEALSDKCAGLQNALYTLVSILRADRVMATAQ